MAHQYTSPGQVLDGTWALQSEFLDSLSALLDNDRRFARLVARTWDRRITPAKYALILRRELLQLSLWSGQRLMLVAKHVHSRTTGTRLESVLGLLPNTAPVVHLLRRAVPFAAHGLPTSVCFPALGEPDGRIAVDALGRALGLDDRLHLSGLPPPAALVHHRGALVVATGKRSSLRRIAASDSPWRVLGAGGRCAVILGAESSTVRRAYRYAASHRVARSCTTVRAGLCVVRQAGRQVVENPWSGRRLRVGLDQVLRRLHPSIVYWVGNEGEPRQLASGGYAAFRATSTLAVSNLAGFGRDPVFHWPGDYCV